MKRIAVKLININNLIISGLISLLGFAIACDDIIDPKDEYGCPYAEFIIKGKVTSENTGGAIASIKVVMGETYTSDDKNYFYGIDSTTSDNEGGYELRTSSTPLDTVTYAIYFKDIDGTKNGSFQNLDTIVTFIDPEFTGASGWYEGEVTQELNIELVPINAK